MKIYKFDILIISTIYLGIIFSNCNNIVNNSNKKPNKTLDRAIEDTIRWSKKESPYIIEDSLVVDSLELLNIESGVTIKCKQGATIINKELIKAIGNENDSIRFTSVDSWSGLKFDNSSHNTNFRHCIFEKYSSLEYSIYLNSSSPTFDNCSFKNFTPAVETGGGTIGCINNSSPIIKNSIIEASGYKGAAIVCENFGNNSPSNPSIIKNDIYRHSENYAVIRGGFLNGNYIEIVKNNEKNEIDMSLGVPVDKVGDGEFNTTSKSCKNVAGIKSPKEEPNQNKN